MNDSVDLAKLKIDREGVAGASRAPRRRSGRRVWVLLLILVVLAVGYQVRTGIIQPRVEVEVGTVSTAYPTQEFTLFNATGYAVPQTGADIASKATGRLKSLEVEEGSRVKKGDVIARLEDEDVVAAMERARANVAVAQAQLAEAKVELKNADVGLARAKSMVAKHFATEEAFDAATARRDKGAALVRSAEAGVGAASAALDEAKVAVEYTLIRAPFGGVILKKYADIGDVVAPFAATTESKGAVVSMADLDTLEVEADVSESNLLKVKVDQPCEIQLDSLPDSRFRGAVHMIVPTVDRSKATVLVKIRFIDKDPRILPDMSARVAFLSRDVTTNDQTPHTVVQPKAVVERDGRRVTFLIDGERVRMVPVQTGAALGDMLIVTNGLRVGDKVVVDPPERLADGSRISLPET